MLLTGSKATVGCLWGFGLGRFTALPTCYGEVRLGFHGCSLERKGTQEVLDCFRPAGGGAWGITALPGVSKKGLL